MVAQNLSIQEIVRALTSKQGVTTSDGNVGGTTIVDASLIGVNDFVKYKTVILQSGDAIYEDRGVSNFDNVTGTITLSSAFTDSTGAAVQIPAGVSYIITNLSTVEVDVLDILAVVNTIDTNVGDPSGDTLTSLTAKFGDLTQDLATILGTRWDVSGDLGTDILALITNLGDPSAHTLKSITAKIGNIARSIDVILGARWDSSGDLGTDIAALIADMAKIPKSDGSVSWNVTALAAINAEVDTALNTIVPASPTAGSLNDILSKAAGGNTFNKATDSLEALADAIALLAPSADLTALLADVGDASASTLGSIYAILGNPATSLSTQLGVILAYVDELETRLTAARAGYLDELGAANIPADIDTLKTATDAKVAGRFQLAATTIDLNQAAATYDLFTGTTEATALEYLIIAMPNEAAGGALTSISIQTDDATPQVLVSAVQGAVANLTAEAQLYWEGKIRLAVGKKIQLTIAGGAHGSAYVCNVNVGLRAVVSGGYLS